MFNTTLLITASGLTLLAAVASGSAQTAPAKPVTTSSGIYTAGQASRGEQTYMNICVSCHPPGTYTAPAFKDKWNGAPLSQLYGLVSQTMPKQEPATLTPEEYSDVVAYLLKINGAPAGKKALPPDPKELKKIRISWSSKAGSRGQ